MEGSFQCSVFSVQKRGCRGQLAACASPPLADKPPMGPASPEQLERAYRVGWDGSKLAKESCAILAHACTCPDISYTCPNIPKHACTCPNIPARPWNHLKAGLRTATADAGSRISPNSPRRRSPRRSACTAPSFPAICNRPATYAAAGIPTILRWRALLGWLSGNGDRHPTRCMRLRPGTLHPGACPLSGQPLRPEEAAASWDERKI